MFSLAQIEPVTHIFEMKITRTVRFLFSDSSSIANFNKMFSSDLANVFNLGCNMHMCGTSIDENE